MEGDVSPPLGVTAEAHFTETRLDLRDGETLLLYTDGLVERREESIQAGLDRLLRVAAGHEGSDVDGLCDHILSALVESDHVSDDVALVAVRPQPPDRLPGLG